MISWNHKKIAIIFFIVTLLLSGCDNFTEIKKNKLITKKFDKNNEISKSVKEKKNLSEENAKLKTLEVLEKYFDEKIYLSEVECYADYGSPSAVKEESKYKNYNLEVAKNALENGVYKVSIFTRKSGEKPSERYYIIVDAKKGELLKYMKSSDENAENSRLTTVDEAESLAKNFIESKKIFQINKATLVAVVKGVEKHENGRYEFIFKDSGEDYKQVSISVDSKSKEICGVSLNN